MLKKLSSVCSYPFSKYLDALYQTSVRNTTPFFTVPSNCVQIIEDPLDFYLLLSVVCLSIRIASTTLRKELDSHLFT